MYQREWQEVSQVNTGLLISYTLSFIFLLCLGSAQSRAWDKVKDSGKDKSCGRNPRKLEWGGGKSEIKKDEKAIRESVIMLNQSCIPAGPLGGQGDVSQNVHLLPKLIPGVWQGPEIERWGTVRASLSACGAVTHQTPAGGAEIRGGQRSDVKHQKHLLHTQSCSKRLYEFSAHLRILYSVHSLFSAFSLSSSSFLGQFSLYIWNQLHFLAPQNA